jgi:hypothetical protein
VLPGMSFEKVVESGCGQAPAAQCLNEREALQEGCLLKCIFAAWKNW